MKQEILSRFLKYISIDTQSDENSTTFPSTEKQFHLARLLYQELVDLGMKNVSLDDNGYIMATLPSNVSHNVPVIGFIAHMDTSPDMPGKVDHPQIIQNYDGTDVIINSEKNLVLSLADFPELSEYKGQTLITTDGTTLLGADDKAGIAEIMTAMQYLLQNPDIPHGEIRVGFTPDEEIGKGVDFFDVAKFAADFAYTMDGGGIGELEFENFNAAGARMQIQGRNIHPGYAKDKMLNALHLAIEFNEMLPRTQRPEHTANYEGFFHLIKIEGTVENAYLQYIIRDHDRQKFEKRKILIQTITTYLNEKYGEGTFNLEIKDQYYNMREKVEPVYHVVETARKAMVELGIEPKVVPIRGGTDGARLSYMGLPCPNIFAGGHNFHGKFEYVPLESMEGAVKVILKIIEMYTKQN